MFSIITSKKDPAGINIYNHLKDYPLDSQLIQISGDTLYSDVDNITGDIIIFGTKKAVPLCAYARKLGQSRNGGTGQEALRVSCNPAEQSLSGIKAK